MEINCPIEKKIGYGFVRLVDIMPRKYTEEALRCDESIVRAARVSFNQGSKGPEKDSKLINFLVDNHHLTPCESVVFQFHIKCPIFVQRHIVKHRMTTMNEISARYTEVKDSWYTPTEFRKQSKSNRQASEGKFTEEENKDLQDYFNENCRSAYVTYNTLLDKGVSRELARTVLPQAMYTSFYLKIDLRNLMHFCNLRNSDDAQFETKQVAEAMEEIMKYTNPVSYETFRGSFKDNAFAISGKCL